MEFSVYDPFLDPVIVISAEGAIQYVNPAGRRWLMAEANPTAGDPLDKFVFFSETTMFSDAAALQPWQMTRPEKGHFRFSSNNYDGNATVCIQKIPYADDFVYAIIVRDLAFASTIDPTDLGADNADIMEQTANSPMSIANDTAYINQSKLFDEVSLTKSIPKDLAARFETKVNIFVVELRLALLGLTSVLSEHWVDAEVKADNLATGLLCNLEIQATDDLKAITTSSKIVDIKKTENETLRIRFKFENLSLLTKRAIDNFLQKHATTF